MRKKMAVMLILTVFVLTPVLGVCAENQKLSEAQEEKEGLENDLEDARKLIQTLKGSKDDIQKDVEKLDKKLNEIAEKVKDLETQLQEKRNEIADTETALNAAKEKEERQYETMKKRMQFIYENGSTSYLELLLSAESFAEFLNAAEYITQISQYDRKMLEEYRDTQKNIVKNQKTLEAEYLSLQDLEKKVQNEKQAVAALESAKKGELAEVSEDIKDAEIVARAYEAEIQAQNEVIAQIQAAQAAAARQAQQEQEQQQQQPQQEQGQPEAGGQEDGTQDGTEPQEPRETQPVQNTGTATGSMIWPCPSSHRITSDYGSRTSPTNGASSNHKGIDIGAAYGADIIAADGGKVLVAAYSSGGGNYVIIDHGGGLCTVYMHASSLCVSAGQTVSKGQVIAKVGSTGISTGNHLHFGVTRNGSYVSPWGYVS